MRTRKATPSPLRAPNEHRDLEVDEENLRKASDAIEVGGRTMDQIRSHLELLAENTPSEFLDKVRNSLRIVSNGLDQALRQAEKVVELGHQSNGSDEEEPDVSEPLGILDMFKITSQTKELDRLTWRVRNSAKPELVSEQVRDPRFLVTTELLLTNPVEARRRFARYLAELEESAQDFEIQQAYFEELLRIAEKAKVPLRSLQTGIYYSLHIPAPALQMALMYKYFDLDNLMHAHGRLADALAQRAQIAARAASVERRHHKNLKSTLVTVFGWPESSLTTVTPMSAPSLP